MKQNLKRLATRMIADGYLVTNENFYIMRDQTYRFGYMRPNVDVGDPPGNYDFCYDGSPTYLRNAKEALYFFHTYCRHYGLPSHNAIAFFDKVEKRENELCQNRDGRELLAKALTIALAGDGFVFSTAADGELDLRVRPCDIPASGEHNDLLDASLYGWMNMSGTSYFDDDVSFCLTRINRKRLFRPHKT